MLTAHGDSCAPVAQLHCHAVHDTDANMERKSLARISNQLTCVNASMPMRFGRGRVTMSQRDLWFVRFQKP